MGQTPGGVPISHNALQYFPEWHGADTCQVWGGTLPGPAGGGGTLLGGVPYWGVPCLGGYPAGGYPARVPPQPGQDGRVPCQVGGTQVGYPPGRVPPWPGQDWGGTQLGQQEYSLHGRRYASCVHAGGLSCMWYFDLTQEGNFRHTWQYVLERHSQTIWFL